MQEIKTTYGMFRRDKSGLWHYHYTSFTGTVDDAVSDALGHKPKKAAWFWFNGTFCPIFTTDDNQTLLTRWGQWRAKYQRETTLLLTELQQLTESSVPA